MIGLTTGALRAATSVLHAAVVPEAWDHCQLLAVHGWIIAFRTGLLRGVKVTIAGPKEIADAYWGRYKAGDSLIARKLSCRFRISNRGCIKVGV